MIPWGLLGLLLLCGGCGRDRPRLRPLGDEAVVVAFGDSLTAGVDVSPNETYPAWLADRLGCRVVNSGVPGERTDAGLRRLPEVLRQYQPDLVILCPGGNDLLQRRDEGEIIANLERMIAMIQARNADLLIIGVPRPGWILKTAPMYRKLAREHRIVYEDRMVAKILSTPSLKSDPIHPNAEGNRRWAEALATLIRQSSSE